MKKKTMWTVVIVVVVLFAIWYYNPMGIVCSVKDKIPGA